MMMDPLPYTKEQGFGPVASLSGRTYADLTEVLS